MSAAPVFLVSVEGEHPPQAFEAYWREVGFPSLVKGDLGSVEWRVKSLQELTILWAGRAWKRASELLASIPTDRRQTTILIGESPSPAVAEKVRRAGGLAAFGWPLPDWAPAALSAALARAKLVSEVDLTLAIQGLADESEHLPDTALGRVMQAAQRLVDSSEAITLVGVPGKGGVFVLSPAKGGCVRESCPEAAKRLGISMELLREAPVYSAAIVFSSLSHKGGRVGQEKNATGPGSVAVLPLKRKRGINVAFQPLGGAILLLWSAPVLLTASDLARLGVLMSFASAALARLSGLALAAIRQHLLSEALAELSRFPGARTAGEHEWIIRGILPAFAESPGLQALWVRVSSSSRRESPWISFPPEPPMARPELAKELTGEEFIHGDGDSYILSRSFPGAPRVGQIITVSDSYVSAVGGKALMQQLSDNLFLAARLIRRAGDSLAMGELSHSSDREANVASAGNTVSACVDADGVKIFVLERNPVGTMIHQLFNSDFGNLSSSSIPPQRVRLGSEKRGFADWVLEHDDWLLIAKRDGPEKTGEKPEICLTGRHGEVPVRARSELEYKSDLPEEVRDRESTMIFFPLASRGKVAGVLAVWRRSPHPFSPDLDVESLAYLAPYVAAICQSALRTRKAVEHEEASALLAREFDAAKTLAQAYLAIARGVGVLGEAVCAVLFHTDPAHNGRLSQSAIWAANTDGPGESSVPTDSFIVECGPHPETWAGVIKAKCSERFPRFRFRSLLTSPEKQPSLAAALFDPADGALEHLFFSDDLLEHFARSYLQFAADLLTTHVRAFGSRLVDEIGGHLETEGKAPNPILEMAAAILKAATNADVVLIYTGTPARMKVRLNLPDSTRRFDFNVLPGSLTEESLKLGEPRRLLDVSDAQVAHQERLRSIAVALGWTGIRSWLCCPIVHEKQCNGLIKLLTKPDGVFFGKDHEAIVDVVSRRVAIEMYKASRRGVLEDMLRLSNEIAGEVGSKLGKKMVAGLHRWAEESLLRKNCQVVIVSRPEIGKSLIMEAAPELSAEDLAAVDDLSVKWGNDPHTWSDSSFLHQRSDAKRASPRAGHAEPISIPGTKLGGHLILLDEEVFQREEIEAMSQAARYMAVLLNGERERVTEKQRMGRFRHAVLGPVQGVTSAARLLAALAGEAGVDPSNLGTLKTRLDAEAEVLRLWRENQRFYQNERVEIKLRRQPLKPVVDRCVERFRDILQERKIAVQLNWPYRGGILLAFDEHAVDLVLSNLLDNARKYSFYQTTVIVSMQVQEGAEEVAISVEDVGHGVPKSHQADIYHLGKRYVQVDPYRTISGEGLGLAMSAAIVNAHGGRIFHSSEKIVEGRAPETTPYQVRFTFTLPLSWRAH